MLVYRGDFAFEKKKDYILEMYVYILLSNGVKRIKNIQHDEHKFMTLKLDFPQIGIDIFLPFRDIYSYFIKLKGSFISLFSYMRHLRESYKFDDNETPFFIKDYESNTLRNQHTFNSNNNFGYFTSISRSSGRAIFTYSDERTLDVRNCYIINKSVFDIKSNESNYIKNDNEENNHLKTGINLGKKIIDITYVFGKLI